MNEKSNGSPSTASEFGQENQKMSDDDSTMIDNRTASEDARRRISRRDVLSSLSVALISSNAGCADSDQSQKKVKSPASTATKTDTPPQEDAEAVSEALENTKSELDAAYSEIHGADLIQSGTREWTPRVRELGNFDLSVAKFHISSAKTSLSEASNNLGQNTGRNAMLEVLRQMTSLAEVGAEFYQTFALTFEKIYQYEYLIDEEGEHDLAVEKMGRARELLGGWGQFSEELRADIQTMADLFNEFPKLKALIPSFDLQKWVIIEEGLREYPSMLESRLIGFEAYAEAREFDKRGVDEMIKGEYPNAQEKLVQARKSIDEAGIHFSKVPDTFDNFFIERAAVYENRVEGLDSGFLLHLRAANAYTEGNTDEAKQLQFEGTAKILDALEKYEVNSQW